MPANKTENNPAGSPQIYRDYNFKLILEGASSEGHFTEVSPICARVTNIPYREGGANQIVHQLAGPVEYEPVTLRYGITDSRMLWDWMDTAMRGVPTRRNVSIVMLKPDGSDGVRWDLNTAWPILWRGAPLDALAKEVAIETLVLVYEELKRS